MRKKTIVLTVVFGMLFLLYGIFYNSLVGIRYNESNASSKLTTTLKVEVYDKEGNLKATRIKDNDLILNNFRNWFLCQFNSVAYGDTVDLIDISNTARTIKCRTLSSSATNTWSDSASGADSKGGIMGIGSGTTAPTQTNYALENIYGTYQLTLSSSYDNTSGNVTITKTIAITGNIDISECVTGVQWIPSAGTTTYKIIMFRDTFGAISCVNGDTFVNTLIISIGTSFNYNFGSFLSGMFTSLADGGSVTKPFYDSSGNVDTKYLYSTGTQTNGMWYVIGNYVVIQHGTGSTAESRNTHALTTKVDSDTVISSSSISGSDVILITDIICGANRALRESDLMYLGGNGDYYMMLRCLYDEVNIVSGHSARHTMTNDM